jgi:hypothetical protein
MMLMAEDPNQPDSDDQRETTRAEARARLWEMIEEIHAANAGTDLAVIEAEVAAAIAEVRAEQRSG